MIKYRRYKTQKKVYYFFLKLLLLLSIIFVFDFSIGKVLSYYYFKQESGLQYRTTYSIEKTTADVLVFGSSRANHHYQPGVFEKRLNLSYYNVGRDGNYIFYHYAVLKGVLKRYSPKIIILDFIAQEFAENQDSYDRISSLLPYYKTHPEMHSIIELKSSYEKLKLASSIYPYNSSIFTIAVGNAEFNKKRRADIKGYVPLTKIWDQPIQFADNSVKYKIDSNKVKMYDLFIQDCLKSHVKLYIVCSPYYSKSTSTDYSITLGKEIANKYNIVFFDYSRDAIFLENPKLFSDPEHLNNEGAELFSNMLIDSISNTVDKKAR